MDELQRLREENARLKNELLALSRCSRKSILTSLSNRDKCIALFGVRANNELLCKDISNTDNNLNTFYCNIFRALNPVAKIKAKSNTDYISYIPLNELDNNDYSVYIETLESVIDTIYYAKAKLHNKRGAL